MAAPRLFGEQRVPIASWAKAHELEQPYVPGRNRYDDDDFQPADVDSLDGSNCGELPQGSSYALDSGRAGTASRYSVGMEPTRLTLDALKFLDEAMTARDSEPEPVKPEDNYVGVPGAEVVPGDAISTASNGSASTQSCADWKTHITKLFKHRTDFVSSMEAWSKEVENKTLDKHAYYFSPQQLGEDTVMDPATGAVTKPPEAPLILVNELENESESMQQCRATQTANAVCAMNSLKSQRLIELESPVLAASQPSQAPHVLPAIPATPAMANVLAPTQGPASPASKPIHTHGSTEGVTRIAHIDRVDLQAVAALSPAPSPAPAPSATQDPTTPTPTGRAPSINKAPAPVSDKDHAAAMYNGGTNEATEKTLRLEQVVQVKTPDTRDKDTVHVCCASESDIDAMLKIYNEEVVKGTQAPGGELATAADFESLLAACEAAGLPLIVALVARGNKDNKDHKENKEVVGLAYLCKARATWKNAIAPVAEPRSVQAHVYVRMRYRGRGIGSMLMRALMGAVMDEEGDENKDKIEFVTVDVVCGSENGVMEREYERVLTQSFGFHAHPDPCDTMHWSKKTSRWLKTQKYYYACQMAGEGEMEAEAAEDESASSPKLLAV